MTQREELIAFGEARGEARGEIKGKIETLFVEVGLAPESIAKKINKSEQYVRDVLANGGFLKM